MPSQFSNSLFILPFAFVEWHKQNSYVYKRILSYSFKTKRISISITFLFSLSTFYKMCTQVFIFFYKNNNIRKHIQNHSKRAHFCKYNWCLNNANFCVACTYRLRNNYHHKSFSKLWKKKIVFIKFSKILRETNDKIPHPTESFIYWFGKQSHLKNGSLTGQLQVKEVFVQTRLYSELHSLVFRHVTP